MNIIVATEENFGIGKNGGLLISIPEDMQFFKNMTAGKVVVMGRKTLESLPNKKPLKNRTNIVLSSSMEDNIEGLIVCKNTESLFEELKKYDSNDVFVIGGGAVYKQLLPYCSKAYVTRIYEAFESDTYFPDLRKMSEWSISYESNLKEWMEIKYQFIYYKNDDIKPLI